jgi:tetratricopeptide (TPR) repeat protein
VHRDLKPENMMVTGEPPHVYVTDFGLARSVEGGSNLSVSGMLIGTPAYMSPEQARGQKADARSDVYGLGATLYHLVAGRPPFCGSSVLDTLLSVNELDPAPPRAADATIDTDLQTIVLKCLEKSPERRYDSANDLADDLDRYLKGEAIRARPASVLYRVRKSFAKRRGAVLAALAFGIVASGVVLALTVPRWRAAERGKKEEQLKAERVADARRRREEAKGPIEEGRRLVDDLRLYLRTPNYAHADAVERAEKARAEFDKALAICPGHADAYLGTGVAFAVANEPNRAREAFDRAIAAAPDVAAPYLERARLSVTRFDRLRCGERGANADDAREADDLRGRILQDLGRVDELSRGNEEQTCARALRAFVEGDQKSALDLIRQVIGIAKADAALHFWHGRIATLLGHPNEPESYFTEAIVLDRRCAEALGARGLHRFRRGNFKGAESDCTRSLDARPDDALVHAWRASARLELGDSRGALEDAARALELQPGLWRPYLVRSAVRLRAGDAAGALEEIERAVAIDAKVADVQFQRGQVMTARGDFREAILCYAAAIECDPKQAAYHVALGRAHRGLDDVEAAIAAYTAALKLDRDHPDALMGRALARKAKGDPKGALKDLDALVKADPTSWDAYVQRAHVRQATGDTGGSLADFTKAIELNPRRPQIRNDRGALKDKLQDYDGALADFDAATAMDANLPEPWTNRGVVLYKKGEYAASADAQTRAIQLRPAAGSYWRRRAEAREKAGDREGAIADARHGLTLKLEPADRKACEALLARLSKDQ